MCLHATVRSRIVFGGNAAVITARGGAPFAPPLASTGDGRLRAGVPVAVIAEIGARPGIVGTVGLHAVGHRIVAAGRHRNRGVVVVVISRRVVARAAIIAVRPRCDRATDDCTGDRAGDEAAAVPAAATAVPATAATVPATAAAVPTTTATAHVNSAATPVNRVTLRKARSRRGQGRHQGHNG